MKSRYKKLFTEKMLDKEISLDRKNDNTDSDDQEEKRKVKASKKTNTVVIDPEYHGAYTGNF